MDDKNPTPVDYEVTQSREIAGQFRKKGEPVTLLPKQAKYYMPPYGTGLKPASVDVLGEATKKARKPAKPDA